MRLLSITLGALLAMSGSAFADAPDLESVETHPTQTAPAAPQAPVKKKKRRVQVFSGRLARQDELRSEPLDKPSGDIKLYAVNFRETIDVNIYNADGTFNDETIDRLNHIWRCKRTDTEKAIDPKLYEILSRIYDKYGRRIELVSGFRNQERTTSYHFNGSASDIRIPGIPDKELHKFVATLDTGGMGLGLYPRAGFIHVDVRPEASYRWVDYSAAGSNDMGRPHKKKKRPRLVANS